MEVLDLVSQMGHEEVVFCHDKETHLKAIIAIHNTVLGPSLGGCRFWNYTSEEDALLDVLRLSRGMTYKAAIAGLRLGGGKAVIIGDPRSLKSEAFFRAFGRFVESLGGRYITAEDVNIRVEDVQTMAKETKYVAGLSTPGGSGDPSPYTALGVYYGIKSAVKFKLKRESLSGMTIAVSGVGSVGKSLCRLLHEDGAKLVVADINETAVSAMVAAFKARQEDPERIHATQCDVYAPCALGAILNSKTIPDIKASVIAGAANNQLKDEIADGMALKKRDILYAPDYVINAGGLINVAQELRGYKESEAKADVAKIYKTLLDIYQTAADQNILTHEASNLIAERRISDHKRRSAGKILSQTYGNQDWIRV